jgi:hypothetical protein
MANWAKAGMILGQGIKETGSTIGGLMIKAEEKRKDRLYAEGLVTKQRKHASGVASSAAKLKYFENDSDATYKTYEKILGKTFDRLFPKGTTSTPWGDLGTTVVKLNDDEKKALLKELNEVRKMAEKAGAKYYMHAFGVSPEEARIAIGESGKYAKFGQQADQLETALGGGGGGGEGPVGTAEQASKTILAGMKPGDFTDLFGSLDAYEFQKQPFANETYGVPVQEMGPGEIDVFEYRKPDIVDKEKFAKITLADLGEGKGSLRATFEEQLNVYKAGLLKAFQDRNIKEIKGRLPDDVAKKELEKMYPELYSEEGKEKIFTLMLEGAEAASGAAQQAEQFSTGEGELDAALEGYNPQYEQDMLMGVNRQTPVGAMQNEGNNPDYTLRQQNPSGEIYATQGGSVSVGEVDSEFPTMAPPLVEEGTYTSPFPQGVDELNGEKPFFSGSADISPEEEALAAFEAGIIEADEPFNLYSQNPDNPRMGDYQTVTIRQLFPDQVQAAEQEAGTAPIDAPPTASPAQGMIGNVDRKFREGDPGMDSGIAKNFGLSPAPPPEATPPATTAPATTEAPSPEVAAVLELPAATYPSMDTEYPPDDGRFEATSIDGVPVEQGEVFENPFRYSDITPTMKNGVLFYDVHTDRSDKPLGQMQAHIDNNPIGVDKGVNWHGLSADEPKGRLAVFDDPMYAYRAAARIIGRDYREKGITTTEGIIREWLKTENEYRQFQDFDKVVSNYLKVIEDVTTLEADAEIATIDDIQKLLYGMTVEETNGHFPYSMSLIREGIDNSGNWSFDKFENRLSLRPDKGSLRSSPDALYLLNEDQISGGESIDVLPKIEEDNSERNTYAQATQDDRNNPYIYVDGILNGRATIADLDGLPPDLRNEVLRILEESKPIQTGQ